MDDATKTKIATLLWAGASPTAVAHIFRCSVPTVCSVGQSYGANPERSRPVSSWTILADRVRSVAHARDAGERDATRAALKSLSSEADLMAKQL